MVIEMSATVLRIVSFCSRYAWWVIACGLVLAAASSLYTVRHFAIKTDVKDLFPADLPWAHRALDYMKAFPQPDVLVVVDAPTPELVEEASTKLANALASRSDVIRTVRPSSGGAVFSNATGYYTCRPSELAGLTDGLVKAGSSPSDASRRPPALRGALNALSLGLMGVQYGQIQLDDLARPMEMASDTIEDALDGRPASFSWQALASGRAAQTRELRRLIEIEPMLDYTALQPGRAATKAIMQTVRDLDLGKDYQARVRLTGLVPMNDDQFATIEHNSAFNAAVSLGAVIFILWLALRSSRIIFAVAVNLILGLLISAATGLMIVGVLNVISVAFFVLFIGLGVDFGLQFSVRYRAERHEFGDLRHALRSAARKAGAPLALATAATAVGFSSFLPTSYLGSFRTRADSRLRDDHRFFKQHHLSAGSADAC